MVQLRVLAAAFAAACCSINAIDLTSLLQKREAMLPKMFGRSRKLQGGTANEIIPLRDASTQPFFVPDEDMKPAWVGVNVVTGLPISFQEFYHVAPALEAEVKRLMSGYGSGDIGIESYDSYYHDPSMPSFANIGLRVYINGESDRAHVEGRLQTIMNQNLFWSQGGFPQQLENSMLQAAGPPPPPQTFDREVGFEFRVGNATMQNFAKINRLYAKTIVLDVFNTTFAHVLMSHNLDMNAIWEDTIAGGPPVVVISAQLRYNMGDEGAVQIEQFLNSWQPHSEYDFGSSIFSRLMEQMLDYSTLPPDFDSRPEQEKSDLFYNTMMHYNARLRNLNAGGSPGTGPGTGNGTDSGTGMGHIFGPKMVSDQPFFIPDENSKPMWVSFSARFGHVSVQDFVFNAMSVKNELSSKVPNHDIGLQQFYPEYGPDGNTTLRMKFKVYVSNEADRTDTAQILSNLQGGMIYGGFTDIQIEDVNPNGEMMGGGEHAANDPFIPFQLRILHLKPENFSPYNGRLMENVFYSFLVRNPGVPDLMVGDVMVQQPREEFDPSVNASVTVIDFHVFQSHPDENSNQTQMLRQVAYFWDDEYVHKGGLHMLFESDVLDAPPGVVDQEYNPDVISTLDHYMPRYAYNGPMIAPIHPDPSILHGEKDEQFPSPGPSEHYPSPGPYHYYPSPGPDGYYPSPGPDMHYNHSGMVFQPRFNGHKPFHVQDEAMQSKWIRIAIYFNYASLSDLHNNGWVIRDEIIGKLGSYGPGRQIGIDNVERDIVEQNEASWLRVYLRIYLHNEDERAELGNLLQGLQSTSLWGGVGEFHIENVDSHADMNNEPVDHRPFVQFQFRVHNMHLENFDRMSRMFFKAAFLNWFHNEINVPGIGPHDIRTHPPRYEYDHDSNSQAVVIDLDVLQNDPSDDSQQTQMLRQIAYFWDDEFAQNAGFHVLFLLRALDAPDMIENYDHPDMVSTRMFYQAKFSPTGPRIPPIHPDPTILKKENKGEPYHFKDQYEQPFHLYQGMSQHMWVNVSVYFPHASLRDIYRHGHNITDAIRSELHSSTRYYDIGVIGVERDPINSGDQSWLRLHLKVIVHDEMSRSNVATMLRNAQGMPLWSGFGDMHIDNVYNYGEQHQMDHRPFKTFQFRIARADPENFSRINMIFVESFLLEFFVGKVGIPGIGYKDIRSSPPRKEFDPSINLNVVVIDVDILQSDPADHSEQTQLLRQISYFWDENVEWGAGSHFLFLMHVFRNADNSHDFEEWNPDMEATRMLYMPRFVYTGPKIAPIHPDPNILHRDDEREEHDGNNNGPGEEFFKPRHSTHYQVAADGDYDRRYMAGNCSSNFCAHLVFSTGPDDEFVLERLDAKGEVHSDLDMHRAPLIMSGNKTIWTISPMGGNGSHFDVILNLRKRHTSSMLMIRTIGQWISPTQAASSVTGVSFDGGFAVDYDSSLLNGHELALYIDLARSNGDVEYYPNPQDGSDSGDYEDGSGSGDEFF